MVFSLTGSCINSEEICPDALHVHSKQSVLQTHEAQGNATLSCLQVCSSSFYIKTLPLFDGGDDVGMVLSPQCFHNLNVHADIFNHSNVHFWVSHSFCRSSQPLNVLHLDTLQRT